jgi:ribonuclease G
LPEWLLEQGIGESRYARIADGEIVEARILLEGIARAGSRLKARLTSVRPLAIAEADLQQFLLPKGAKAISEGQEIVIQVTREAIPGAEPWKRPLAIVADEGDDTRPPLDAEALSFPSPSDPLGQAGWPDLLEEARSGIVRFQGGELRISPTPAMTLIDVDGYLPPLDLALAGAEAAARAILRLDIGGSIGIDLPTVAGKAERQSIASAIDSVLAQPFERTAVNGFGFVRGQRLRLRPVGPAAGAGIACRACTGPTVVRGAGAAPARRARGRRCEAARR